jgi:hypothetical protein
MLADYGAGSPGSPLTSGPTESRANVYLLDGEEMYRFLFQTHLEKKEKTHTPKPRIFSAGLSGEPKAIAFDLNLRFQFSLLD